MLLTVLFGHLPSERLFYSVEAVHTVQDISDFLLRELQRVVLLRVTAVICGREIPVQGHINGQSDHNAYVKFTDDPISANPEEYTLTELEPVLSTRSNNPPAPVMSLAETPIKREGGIRKRALYEDVFSEMTLHDTADVIVDESRSELNENGRSSPSMEENSLSVKKENGDQSGETTDEQQDHSKEESLVNHSSPQKLDVTYYCKINVGDKIEQFDLSTSLDDSQQSVAFLIQVPDIMEDRIVRPRLVRHLGRILMNRCKRQYFPCKDEYVCIISRLLDCGITVDTDDLYRYLLKYSRNQRTYLRRCGLLQISEMARKRKSLDPNCLSEEMLNTKLQSSVNGTAESLKLMEMTRAFRVRLCIANLSDAIGQCRQLADFPLMVERDAECIHGVSFKKNEEKFKGFQRKLIELYKAKFGEAAASITDFTTLKATLTMVSAMLQTITVKRKMKNPVDTLYYEFEAGSIDEAITSMNKNTRANRASGRVNGHVQPVLFRIDGIYYINVCAREVRVGEEKINEIRSIFVLLSYYMAYRLSYSPATSDIMVVLELMAGYKLRRGMSIAAKTLFKRMYD